MAEWLKTALIDIVELIGGGTPKTSKAEYWGGNINWLSVKDFNNENRYVYSTEKTITEEGLNNSSTKLLKKDDIIISARGTVGELAMITFPMAFNQSCYGIRAKEGIDSIFLYYLIKNSVRKLKAITHGSVFDTITRDTFANIEVAIPDIKTQHRIAKMLADIDDKVENNQRINNNLEQQAKALYKDWFFNFSPFSSDGNLPDDWRLGTVGDIIQLHDSKRVPLSGAERDKMAKVYPYYGATSLMDYVDNYLFDGIYILLGEDGTVVDSLGFPILQYVYGQFWVNNHAHIITGKEGFSVEELYLFFSLTNIKSIVTGAVQQKVSQQNLKKVPAIIPSKEALGAFDEITQPIFAQIRNLKDENANLSQLRDTLLPKLMSGELDVSDIEI
ncbi:restriction endonuclease subunit S [Clostridium sp. AM27-31LB]|uniref:restriction endonuclease subunit S n=1 Tax=Clostridium sp. AM27-31LB TaxID=2293026 RepID=UPI000E535A55|nr:restriction endonuclease subunit S [Clostridium sp. AM27-31LB]RHT86034.1 restriction endonuclease subunit S [Clostridium sp. AM27-31LB]